MASYVDFNKSDKPWRFHTTAIIHDNNLITDENFLHTNNDLEIESITSDIKFFVNDSNKIQLNGDTLFTSDVSFLQNSSFKDLTCNNLTVIQDVSINGSLYINNISIESMEQKIINLENSFNDLVQLANKLGITI